MVLFISGARHFLKVNFMAMLIQTGRNNFFHVIERSFHSKKGVIRINRHPLRIVEIITRSWNVESLKKTAIGNHHATLGYLVAGDQNNKQMTVEDVLIWENLVAIASVAFINLVKPDTNNNYHGRNAKRKKKKNPIRKKLIDGLPVLRGMFICPESLLDSHNLSSSDQGFTEREDNEQKPSFK